MFKIKKRLLEKRLGVIKTLFPITNTVGVA